MSNIDELTAITQKLIEAENNGTLLSRGELIAYLLAIKELQEERSAEQNTIHQDV
jgi:hypothetical protein